MTGSIPSLLNRIRNARRRHGGLRPLARAVWRFARERGAGALLRRLDARSGLEAPSSAQGPDQSVPLPGGRPRDPVWLAQPPGVLLVGHPYLISGRGEDVRMAANALAATGIPFHIRNTFDAGEEHRPRLARFAHFDRLSRSASHRANLFVLNADEMIPARNHLGPELCDSGYRIGYWAWELSRFPDAWSPALDLVDEIWAPSRFIQQAIAEKTRRPVVRMPLVVDPEPGDLPRSHFGLPDDRFLFLFFFDFSSFVARKNPWAAIEAFERAFPGSEREGVGLVIKLNGGQLRPDDYRAFLEHEAIRRPGVWVIDQILSDREIRGLMNGCDAFVSLHRSEGFGRGPAEAMHYGKPVIVTGYSGNLDFCNDLNACVVDHTLVAVGEGEYPHGEGQLWAEADVDQASWYMRRLVSERAFAERIADAGARSIREFNGAVAVGRRYAARLDALGLI
ncbi:hypothetical protein D779_3993 [Imhoffiella purpurea]|uniref:Glycosyl transferase family 1 domain-containing protein n=1 Tax=Imhoffiella purpurea TaxID=1249627 RepID=W9VB60_9GAMM|nr:hypothetical protein D779_3993 [Imhoffiella purpurea]